MCLYHFCAHISTGSSWPDLHVGPGAAVNVKGAEGRRLQTEQEILERDEAHSVQDKSRHVYTGYNSDSAIWVCRIKRSNCALLRRQDNNPLKQIHEKRDGETRQNSDGNNDGNVS